MKKTLTTLLITIALISTACSSEKTTNQNVNKNIRKENINVTRNDEGTYTSFNGKRTNAQGVIIGEEVDENGIMQDCAMGSTGQQIGIPSCSSISTRRVASQKKTKMHKGMQIEIADSTINFQAINYSLCLTDQKSGLAQELFTAKKEIFSPLKL
jgi:PBP1b-binding outer membrane lipoprotein LpoB